MTTDLLTGDFFGYESLLPDDERKDLLALREFLDEKVRPRVNAAWAAAEFPMDLIPEFASIDVVGRPTSGRAARRPRSSTTASRPWSSRASTPRSPPSSACTTAWRWGRS